MVQFIDRTSPKTPRLLDEITITTKPWRENLFNCETTDLGRRKLDEMATRLRGIDPATGMIDEERMIPSTEVEQEYPVDVIGKGAHRVVMSLPSQYLKNEVGCIAKVQRGTTGNQTRAEAETWQQLNGSQAALMAPVLESDRLGRWLLMPQARTSAQITHQKAKEIAKRLRMRARNQGLSSNDIRPANVGVIENRGVVIDYGDVTVER